MRESDTEGWGHEVDISQTHAHTGGASTKKKKVACTRKAVERHKYLGQAPGEGLKDEEEMKTGHADQREASK